MATEGTGLMRFEMRNLFKYSQNSTTESMSKCASFDHFFSVKDKSFVIVTLFQATLASRKNLAF